MSAVACRGTSEVAPGEDIDLSDVPEETSSPHPAMATSTTGGEETKLRGADATAAVTAAVEACTIACTAQAAREHDDGAEHSSGGTRRVRFVEGGREKDGSLSESGLDQTEQGKEGEEEEESDSSDGMHQDEEEAEEDGGAEGSRSWGRPGGREEVARILSERFLAGGEEGVDYRAVDGDERLDDLDQLARDEVR